MNRKRKRKRKKDTFTQRKGWDLWMLLWQEHLHAWRVHLFLILVPLFQLKETNST